MSAKKKLFNKFAFKLLYYALYTMIYFYFILSTVH